VIAAHELIWDLTDRLRALGDLELPHPIDGWVLEVEALKAFAYLHHGEATPP
jgi:hypothetical protein